MYKYYSTERPVAPGTFPNHDGNKAIEIANYYERRYVDEIDWMAWGFVTYEHELSEEDVKRYELMSETVAYEKKLERWGDFKRKIGKLALRSDSVFAERLAQLIDTEIGRDLIFNGGAENVIAYKLWKKENITDRIVDYMDEYDLDDDEVDRLFEEVTDTISEMHNCGEIVTWQKIDWAIEDAIEQM